VQVLHPQIPLHALVDFDPDGLAIMHTYKHGSQNLEHEQHARVPGLLWMGIKSADALACRPSFNRCERGFWPAEQVRFPPSESTLLPLKPVDRKLAIKMLQNMESQHDQRAEQMLLTRELQLMLMLNVKAEIQTIHRSELPSWLDERLVAMTD
jgi:meiotic recombination protein SPO11